MASIVLVAGDPSGDAHAARLVNALSSRAPSLTVTALGGPALHQAGAVLLDDLTATATIGPFDAARHLTRFARARRLLEEHLRTHRPDLVILVDFGDFNLPVIAPLVKRYGIPIIYYISPQIWAWGGWRMRLIRRYVDHMIVFFKFEETPYRQAGVPVTWVGHPLIASTRPSLSVDEARTRFGLNPWRRTVGLLPGSRDHEIRRHLPLLLNAAQRILWQMPGIEFLIPKAPAIPLETIASHVSRVGLDVHVVDGPLAEALQAMDAAVVVSGTATLEAALCEVPMVVVYRTSWATYLAARGVVRTPHIGLVNVVAGERIVPELIQHHATAKRIANEIVSLLRDAPRSEQMRQALRQLNTQLGPPGAVDRAATSVLEFLSIRVA